MKQLFFAVFCLAVWQGCKNKKEITGHKPKEFFPVPAYIMGELKRMDTSLQTFMKIETVNGRTDTSYIKNTEVRAYASDFAALPDIGSEELRDDYEDDHIYDDLQKAFVFTFSTKENHPIKREDVVVEPEFNAEGKHDVRSIFVEVWEEVDDTLIRKNMFWEAGKGFQIITTKEPPKGEPMIKDLQVKWNGFDERNR